MGPQYRDTSIHTCGTQAPCTCRRMEPQWKNFGERRCAWSGKVMGPVDWQGYRGWTKGAFKICQLSCVGADASVCLLYLPFVLGDIETFVDEYSFEYETS